MTARIQILLVAGTLMFFIALLSVIRKDKISSDMACLWIVFSLILVIMAINPNLATTLANALGFFSAINALYFVNNLIQRYALDEEKKKKEEKTNG